ncbi:unnamed protein product, partial [Pararhodospirillum photometricum DSM 122]
SATRPWPPPRRFAKPAKPPTPCWSPTGPRPGRKPGGCWSCCAASRGATVLKVSWISMPSASTATRPRPRARPGTASLSRPPSRGQPQGTRRGLPSPSFLCVTRLPWGGNALRPGPCPGHNGRSPLVLPRPRSADERC